MTLKSLLENLRMEIADIFPGARSRRVIHGSCPVEILISMLKYRDFPRVSFFIRMNSTGLYVRMI